MLVYIYSQVAKQGDKPYIDVLFKTLAEQDIQFKVLDTFYDDLCKLGSYEYQTFSSYTDFIKDKPDFLITLGGDGTILSAMTYIRDLETPILGINLGRLGFLASTEKTIIEEAILKIKKKAYSLQRRSMLSLATNADIFGDTKFALNDFTISKRDTSSMVIVHTYVNDEFLNSYWADGIIVATPTGSTGYSLSCGGPIVHPGTGNFVITPIAPHNLNVRPIVLPDSATLRFQIEGRSDNFLCTLDARFEAIQDEDQLIITRSKSDAVLINLEDVRFMNTIRNKLNWGLDKRN